MRTTTALLLGTSGSARIREALLLVCMLLCVLLVGPHMPGVYTRSESARTCWERKTPGWSAIGWWWWFSASELSGACEQR